MGDNLKLYNAVRVVPQEAQKAIAGGRLKGKTDINPMWRIKALTDQFGVCGIGWKYVIKEKRLELGANNEIAAFLDIDLFIKQDGEWSDGIPGTGGSSFVAKESNGLYTSDECFKMALTDAISVSCKALGFGADIYWQSDKSKYDTPIEYITLNQAKVIAAKLKPYGDNGIEYVKKVLLPKYEAKDSQHIKAVDYENVIKDIVNWTKEQKYE